MNKPLRGLLLALCAALPFSAGATFASSTFQFQNLGLQGAAGGSFYQAGDTAEQVYTGTPFMVIDQVLLDAYFTSDFTGVDSPLFDVLVNNVVMGSFYGNNTHGGVAHLQFWGNAGSPGVAMTPNGTWHVEVVLTDGIPIGGGAVQFLDGGDYTPRVTLVHDDPPPPGGNELPLPGSLGLTAAALAALGLTRRGRHPVAEAA